MEMTRAEAAGGCPSPPNPNDGSGGFDYFGSGPAR